MLLQTIEQIGREKNIEPAVIIEAIEEAMAVAAQKFYRTEEQLVARLNKESGEVELHAVKTVVDEVEDPDFEITVEEARESGMKDAQVGDEWRKQMPTDQLGRIAAQAAKQVIYQNLRDAERDNIFEEYVERVGELLTGIVKRFERGDMIIDLGRTEAVLPRREQSRAEHYNVGDRIRVVIVEVLRATRGPQVVVSRNSPDLLRRLFEMEVPEIYDGTVVIKGAVREGGDRAKVAVHSLEADVDAVGACVGMRGSRVQSIIRELRGEKIDIVEWAEGENQFAINSLKPARVNRVNEIVVVDETGFEEPHLEVIVNEDQLSLAIGKRGQNVRLAGKLLGRKIDVKSEEQKRAEAAAALSAIADASIALEDLPGVGPKAADALREAGLGGAKLIAEAGVEALTGVPGIGPKTAAKIFEGACEAMAAAGAPVVRPTPPVPADEEPVIETTAAAVGSAVEDAAEAREAVTEVAEDAGAEPGEIETPATSEQPEREPV